MPVAKSYKDMKILCEPYKKNGRNYVQVEGKNGPREVRWYTDYEYQKMYPGEVVDHSKDPFYKTQKELFGFTKGYIYIFTGNTYAYKDWFKENGCKYTRWWGWGWGTDQPAPEQLPEGIEMKELPWSLIGTDEEKLLPDDQIAAALETILYDPGTSEYYGEVGDKIELELTVTKNITLDGYYGTSHMHIMEDEDGNVFVWTTQAKDWEDGSVHKVAGTIKDHRTYKNVKQTILTRCREK